MFSHLRSALQRTLGFNDVDLGRTRTRSVHVAPIVACHAHRNTQRKDHMPPPHPFSTGAAAEGRAGRSEIVKTSSFCTSSPQRAGRAPQDSQKTSSFAPRPRRSPQRVARADQKSQKPLSFCTSTTPIPAEGRKPDRKSKSCPGALES